MGGKQSKGGDSGRAHAAVAPRVIIKPRGADGAAGDESKADAEAPKGTFTLEELAMIDKAYAELAAQSPGPTISKEAFLRRFPLPGMMGERLFQVIDRDNTGVIDKINYLIAVRLLTKESADGKIKLIFDMFDADGSGAVTKDEMSRMLTSSATSAFHILCQFDPPKNAEERDARLREMIAIAEHMKDDAFENFDTNTDGKLTFEQFQAWSRGTPEVMHMLESVIGSDGSALLDSRASAGADGAK